MHAAELVLGIGWRRSGSTGSWPPSPRTGAAWANAAKPCDDDQLGALVCLIALISLYDRLNGITQQVTTHPFSGIGV